MEKFALTDQPPGIRHESRWGRALLCFCTISTSFISRYFHFQLTATLITNLNDYMINPVIRRGRKRAIIENPIELLRRHINSTISGTLSVSSCSLSALGWSLLWCSSCAVRYGCSVVVVGAQLSVIGAQMVTVGTVVRYQYRYSIVRFKFAVVRYRCSDDRCKYSVSKLFGIVSATEVFENPSVSQGIWLISVGQPYSRHHQAKIQWPWAHTSFMTEAPRV
jgi:hypothetical protein